MLRFLARLRRTAPSPETAARRLALQERERAERERVERIQQREREAEANVAVARARAALEAAAAARAVEAENEAFRELVTRKGSWLPGDTRSAPRSRLSGRPTLGERFIEAVRVGWDAARRG